MPTKTGPRISYVGKNPEPIIEWLKENASPEDYKINLNKQRVVESIEMKIGLIPPALLKGHKK